MIFAKRWYRILQVNDTRRFVFQKSNWFIVVPAKFYADFEADGTPKDPAQTDEIRKAYIEFLKIEEDVYDRVKLILQIKLRIRIHITRIGPTGSVLNSDL